MAGGCFARRLPQNAATNDDRTRIDDAQPHIPRCVMPIWTAAHSPRAGASPAGRVQIAERSRPPVRRSGRRWGRGLMVRLQPQHFDGGRLLRPRPTPQPPPLLNFVDEHLTLHAASRLSSLTCLIKIPPRRALDPTPERWLMFGSLQGDHYEFVKVVPRVAM
ncbi:unnamed protein product [Caenorhabditis auriculariae]|uniref:Uncharacterized protein n=1 Tax=Caenorhabditis auriculariae TaxID=2777116 RepID=A0A8S1HT99_9PELO|nr:unnamed protein product [Caenorhabditis auriculariae]